VCIRICFFVESHRNNIKISTYALTFQQNRVIVYLGQVLTYFLAHFGCNNGTKRPRDEFVENGLLYWVVANPGLHHRLGYLSSTSVSLSPFQEGTQGGIKRFIPPKLPCIVPQRDRTPSGTIYELVKWG